MTMKTLVATRASAAWLVLVALTCVSWALGAWHGSTGDHVSASLIIIAAAMFKIRLVGLYFMQLREAPRLLRGILECYCVVLLTLLCALYLR